MIVIRDLIALYCRPKSVTNHSPTLPTISTGSEANTQKALQEQADQDIDAERYPAATAAGLGVTAEPEAMWTAAGAASVLWSPGRGPGFDVNALSAAIRVPRIAVGRPPRVKSERGQGQATLIKSTVCGILPPCGK